MATLTNRLLYIRDAVEIHSEDGRKVLAEVKRQLVALTHGAKVNVTGLQLPLEVHGDLRGRNFEVWGLRSYFPEISCMRRRPCEGQCSAFERQCKSANTGLAAGSHS